MNQPKIGKFISECRKIKGLIQNQLAEKLGITDKAVSKWETGKSMPDLYTTWLGKDQWEYTSSDYKQNVVLKLQNVEKVYDTESTSYNVVPAREQLPPILDLSLQTNQQEHWIVTQQNNFWKLLCCLAKKHFRCYGKGYGGVRLCTGNMQPGFETASLPLLIALIMVILVMYINTFMIKQRAKEFATYLLCFRCIIGYKHI